VDYNRQGGGTVPVVPHYPTDDDRRDDAPDIDRIVDRIIRGGDGPSSPRAPPA